MITRIVNQHKQTQAPQPAEHAGAVLILGCGWIGRAFAAEQLSKGYTVYATTTRAEKAEELEQEGIKPLIVDFDQEIDLSLFPAKVDFILNSIPATKRLSPEVLQRRFAQLGLLLGKLAYRKHLFLSSVGIYPDQSQVFTEAFPVAENSNLRMAEKAMLQHNNSLVYRLGGLFGKDRVLAKYFQHKTCGIGAQPANFVHIEDVLRLLVAAKEHKLVADIYNVVCPAHPSKEAVIRAGAQRYGFSLPAAFDDATNFQKIVSGYKLQNELKYSFLYESPILF